MAKQLRAKRKFVQAVNVRGSVSLEVCSSLEHVDFCSCISILCGQRIIAEVILPTGTEQTLPYSAALCTVCSILSTDSYKARARSFVSLHLDTAAEIETM